MREIKFRLLSPIKKIVGYEKWYPGSMDSKNFYVANPCWLYSEDGEYWNPKRIEHRTKEQFTGLKDKNGKEIYEGDIVEAWDNGRKGTFEVRWRNEGAPMFILWPAYQEGQLWELKGPIDTGAEIIGNIYENPELVKP